MSERERHESSPSVADVQTFRRRRWKRFLKWSAIFYAVYIFMGFFVLPPIIRFQMMKHLPSLTKRDVDVRKVHVNPLALSFRLEGLAIREPNGDVFASIEEFYINFQASSLFRLAWTFEELRLRQPYGHVILARDGKFNFENMIPPPDPDATKETSPPNEENDAKAKVPPVLIRHFHIQEAALTLDDLTHRLPLHAELNPINIAFTNLTTRVDENSPHRIVVASDTFRQLAWTGRLQFEPFDFRGTLVFEDGRLGRTTPVVRDFARLEVVDGKLDAHLEFQTSLGTNGLSVVITNSMVGLKDLEVKDLNSGLIVSSIGSLQVSSIEASLQDRSLHVGSIRIDRLSKFVQIDPDGSINFNSLLELPAVDATNRAPVDSAALPAGDSSPWVITLDELAVGKSMISFTDLSRDEPFQSSVGPIEFQLTDFSTQPDHDASYEFSVTTGAGEHVAGQGIISLVPTIRSRGQVRLTDLHIPSYRPYFGPFLHGELTSGLVSAGAGYDFAWTPGGPAVTVTNAELRLADLRIETIDPEETVFSLASLEVSGTRASLTDQSIDVGAVRSSGARINVRQNEDGSINLLSLIPPALLGEPTRPVAGANPNSEADPATTDLSQPPDIPWDLIVREIDFHNYAIDVEDRKTTTPARIRLAPLGFQFRDVTLKTNSPIAFAIFTGVQGQGEVRVEGKANLFPPRAEWSVKVEELGLPVIQPYLGERLALLLAQGKLRAHGRVVLERLQNESGAIDPEVSFTGDVGVVDFLTLDRGRGQELVRWNDLGVRGIDLQTKPQALRLDSVDLNGFHASVIVDPNGAINLVSVLPSPDTHATNAPPVEAGIPVESAPSSEPDASPMIPVEIGVVNVDRFSFRFLDQTLRPPFNFVMEEMGGTVSGISTKPDSTIEVDLSGHVNRDGPFFVRGQVQPLARELGVHMAVAFTNTDLTPLTPYLEKYAGHPMLKGQLNMALRYDIRGDALKAENEFQVGQLTLGARNDSPDATTLPVKLAVALLKDRRGNIELDVPLGGKLSDPEFAILPIVAKTVMNLIARAATSPFSLLGAVLGGDSDGEALSFVTFPPGRAELPDEQAAKLDKLARALHERPAVNLEIKGEVDSVVDRTALAEAALAAAVSSFETRETAVTNMTEEAAANFKTARKTSPAATLIAWPESKEGWLTAYFFRCAETNVALLPETNLVFMLTGTNAVTEPIVAEEGEKELSENEAAALVESKMPAPPRRTRYFSTHKGATLLRSSTWEAPSSNHRRASRRLGKDGPPTPEALAQRLGLNGDVIETRLIGSMPVPEHALRDLRRSRGKAVESYLLGTEKVERLRLLVVNPADEEGDMSGQTRAVFTLN